MEVGFAATAEEQPGVTIRRGVSVREYATGPGAIDGVPHVSGVTTDAGETLLADLVVEATGRSSSIGGRITGIGGRAPVDTQVDNSAIYYTRYYRSRTGELPDYRGGPLFTAGQSIGLFLIPADNATWCLAVWGMADDHALRPVRQVEIFDAVVRQFPDRDDWLDGEPLTDVLPFVSGGDLNRAFVIDGEPCVTGLVAVGDAHAFTEPRLGRGTLFSVMNAALLRDTVRDHLDGGPAEMAFGWDEAFRQTMTPWLRASNSIGRGFAKETRTYVAGGTPNFDPSNQGQVLSRALENAARVDAKAGRWLIELAGSDILPGDLFAQPSVLDRIMELGDHDNGSEPAGPNRLQLLDLLAGR